MMFAQISVRRVRAGLGQQAFEHHVLAPAFREVFAIDQCADARVAVLFSTRPVVSRCRPPKPILAIITPLLVEFA